MSHIFIFTLIHNISHFHNWLGENVFEVRCISIIVDKYKVNIDTQECTYRKWLLTGIPCYHAIIVMKFLNLNVEDYIPYWFRLSTYEETYHFIIYPVSGQLLLDMTTYNDVQPPLKKRLPGRPKEKEEIGIVGVKEE